jgi:hypothetical protein
MAENNNGDGGNAGGGQNNDGGAQNQGGDGKNTNSGGAGSSTGQQQNQGGQSNTGSGSGSEKTFTQADVDRILAERLGRTKQQHDADLAKARENASKPLQQQLDELTKKLNDRQTADVERNGKLALSQVYSQLAEAGVKKSDVEGLLKRFDAKALLKDGEPDDAAIAEFAKDLARTAGQIAPDLDQGQGGSGSSPQTMGDFMRQMARNRR